MLVLKRFTNAGLKNEDAVVVPLKLNVTPYIKDGDVSEEASDVNYVLRSKILHSSKNLDSGESIIHFSYRCYCSEK